MKSIYIHLKVSIVIIFLLFLICCNKKPDPIISSVEVPGPKGFWKLNSVTVNDIEQLNTLYEENSYNFITSCSTALALRDSTVFYFATLALYDTYIFEERYSKKSAFNDSTYNSCLPQYLADSTLEELKGGCEIDDKNISITYQYGNSPGGFPLYNSHTYVILELTDSTLKISGPYPVAYLYGWNTGIFSFSK